jgi:tripartite-type tricarboxylate transporter receptor subunit TctC
MQPSLARRALLGTGLAMALALPAVAQEYPNKPVRIIVPFAPGDSADAFGRFVAQKLQESLGQNFVMTTAPAAAR